MIKFSPRDDYVIDYNYDYVIERVVIELISVNKCRLLKLSFMQQIE